MYQMLKLKLGPQDIRGTEMQSKDGEKEKQLKKKKEMLAVFTKRHHRWTTRAHTYFDESAGKHLLVDLVL